MVWWPLVDTNASLAKDASGKPLDDFELTSSYHAEFMLTSVIFVYPFDCHSVDA